MNQWFKLLLFTNVVKKTVIVASFHYNLPKVVSLSAYGYSSLQQKLNEKRQLPDEAPQLLSRLDL